MKRIRHADEVVGAVGAFGDHHVGDHAREIGLICKRDQVEHQPDLLVEVLELTERRVRHVEPLEVARARHRHAPFELANGIKIIRKPRLVTRAKIIVQRLGALV